MVCELTDAIGIGVSELVEALIVVSYDEQVGPKLLHPANELLITMVQVLILIH